MLDVLYHGFNYLIAGCYFTIFLLIFTGLVRHRAFGRNTLGTATSGIFLTCGMGHLAHALFSHAMGTAWEVGVQVVVDGWTVIPAVTYLVLRSKFGLIVSGPDMISEYQVQLAQQSAQIKAMHEFEVLKDDFLAMASHELRTPLTTIKGYSQILTKRLANFNEQRVTIAVETINQQVDRMNNLINMLLDVSRIQSRKFQNDKQPLDFTQLVHEVITRLQVTSSTHQLNLQAPHQHLWIEADNERVEQVIINLVNNAIKYSPSAQQIEVSVEATEQTVQFHVKDYGIGISEAALPRVFERFYRSPDVTHSNREGFGLGLYICNEIVQASSGKISVVSKAGEGSIFTVSLPRIMPPGEVEVPELISTSS